MSEKPITQKFVDEWYGVSTRAGKMEDEIVNRIDYILRTLFSIFGNNLDYWYFDGAGEGEVGDLARWMDDIEISGIYTEVKGKTNNEIVIIDKEGDEWHYEGILQTRWLFEDFEQEIRDGKEKFKQHEIERKTKLKRLTEEKKKETARLVEEAKKKLSKEELAALRKSL